MELCRFAFSTNAFSRHPLAKALREIARTGFRGVEILADKPHAWLDSFTADDVSGLRKQLDKLGLFVSNINANCTAGFWNDAPPEPFFEPSLISRDKTLREWRLAYTKKALRLAKALGAHNVSITSGKTLNGVPPEKGPKAAGRRVVPPVGGSRPFAAAPVAGVRTVAELLEQVSKGTLPRMRYWKPKKPRVVLRWR